MAVGRINVTGGRIIREKYGRFAGTTKSGRNNEVTVLPR